MSPGLGELVVTIQVPAVDYPKVNLWVGLEGRVLGGGLCSRGHHLQTVSAPRGRAGETHGRATTEILE